MTIIITLFGIVIAGVVILILLRWHRLRPYNQSPLKIKTFDGLDSPFHPSVLYFENGWNGWKYWMVETPFSPKCKPYVDRNECPSIHVSNDGVNWSSPDGLQNPLVNFGEEGERNLDYYSDPHLVMVGDRMECWYRLTQRHGEVDHRDEVSLRRVYSVNGIDWSEEEIISRLWQNYECKGLGKMVVSQAILHDDDIGYRMWYVNSEDHIGKRGVSYSLSKNGLEWSDAVKCRFDKDINPWHIDVMEDDDNTLLMTIYDHNNLILCISKDGLEWSFVRILLSPSHVVGSFYRNGLYRSCLVKDSTDCKLYFSAYDYDITSIGLAKLIPSNYDVHVISNGNNKDLLHLIGLMFGDFYRKAKFIVSHFLKSQFSR